MNYGLSRTSNANRTNFRGFTVGEADILRRAMGKKEGRIRQTKRKIYYWCN